MTTVELNDIVVHYPQRGSGPPVVLLHGLAEDHRSWDAVVGHLDSFSTYAVDLRGHGRTTTGRSAGTLSQLSDDLAAFLSAVTGPAAVVGYSLGGTVGLKAATTAPTLIRHLIVVATSSVVGSAAAEFFAGRIAQIEDADWDGFAAGLRDDTSKQVVTDADRRAVQAGRPAHRDRRVPAAPTPRAAPWTRISAMPSRRGWSSWPRPGTASPASSWTSTDGRRSSDRWCWPRRVSAAGTCSMVPTS